MAGLTLDSGALIAVEKHNREIVTLLKAAAAADVGVTIPVGVLAQTWRRNSPMIARLLQASDVENMAQAEAKEIGAALAASKTSDIVDGSVVVSALKRGDTIVTSDANDLRAIAAGLGEQLHIFEV